MPILTKKMKSFLKILKYYCFGHIFEIYISLYKEIGQPADKDLQNLIDEHYNKYLLFGWKIIYSLDALLRTIAALLVFFTDEASDLSRAKI